MMVNQGTVNVNLSVTHHHHHLPHCPHLLCLCFYSSLSALAFSSLLLLFFLLSKEEGVINGGNGDGS